MTNHNAALAAALAQRQGVAVKPLEWKEGSLLGSKFTDTVLGRYTVLSSMELTSSGLLPAAWIDPRGYHHEVGSLEIGLAAAEADYEARIRSTLVPSADQAEVERLRTERDEAVIRYGEAIAEAARLRDESERRRLQIVRYMNDDPVTDLARMRQEQPIESAPRDGTRILIKTVTFGWNTDICQNVATGDKWVEAKWAKDLSGTEQWLEWCGNERTHTCDRLTPLAWAPLPSNGEGQ